MKKPLCSLLLIMIISGLFFSNSAKAQYVTVDPAIVAFLQEFIQDTSCLNAQNQLDTSNPIVLNLNEMILPELPQNNLSGIRYFKNLDTLQFPGGVGGFGSCPIIPPLPSHLRKLVVYDGQVDSISPLPQTLVYLDCSNNLLTSLPALPDSLLFLNCSNQSPFTPITSLPAMPNTLTYLDCHYNGITHISSLGSSLQYLDCSYNQLTSLPALPNTLAYLGCSWNMISTLPALSDSLYDLDCGENQISILPALPANLNTLSCYNNQLSVLPALPAKLQTLTCYNNNLTALPAFPHSLQTLSCSNNHITSLPALADTVLNVDVSNNPLHSISAFPSCLSSYNCSNDSLSTVPPFPVTCNVLQCAGNQLTSLPALPVVMLVQLDCSYNQLSSLPALPDNGFLQILNCAGNNLSSLPPLVSSLQNLNCDSNINLACLPDLKNLNTLWFLGTSVTCIPTYYPNISYGEPLLDTFPLCGLWNAGGCEPLWNISGKVFYDANYDCVFDSADAEQGNVKVFLYQNGNVVQQTYTVADGGYAFACPPGTYQVRVSTSNLPFSLNCTTPDSVVTTTLSPLSENNNFPLSCAPGFDVGVKSMNIGSSWARPGGEIELYSQAGDLSQLYEAHCASGISGQVQLTFSGPIKYAGVDVNALTPASVAGNTITWNIADYVSLNEQAAFNVLFNVDSNAVNGSQLCFTMSVTPLAGDNDTNNNTLTYCTPVVNSFDPNEKEVYPGGIASAGQWLTYTVRFQNTGTAPALNIQVTDTLNPNVDPKTFELLSYSAKNITQVFGNIIDFNFPGINLPDSGSNEPASHGFVQFRVQANNPLASGAIVKNTASIYFDLNNPVQTNTVENCEPLYDTAQASITCGDSLLIGNIYYKSGGSYNDTLQAGSGCDSIVTVQLSVTGGDTVKQSSGICAGDSVIFYGTWLYNPGTYQTTLPGNGACDTTVILTLNAITPPVPTNLYDTICRGDSAYFNRTYYSEAGTYSAQYTAVSGCDSTVNFNLAVRSIPPTNTSNTITCGDSVLFNGIYYNLSGTYTETLASVNGCDSIVNLQLTVIGGDTTYLSDTTCANDSVLFGGAYYNTGGTYVTQLNSSANCDSTIILQLTVYPVYNNNTAQSISCGDSVYFNGNYQHLSGNYYDTLSTINGCDSIITLQLTVIGGDTTYLADTICGSDSVLFNNVWYGVSGIYTAQYNSSTNCDSTVILQLLASPLPVVTFTWDSLLQAGDVFQPPYDTGTILWCPFYFPNIFTLSGGNPSGGHYSGFHISGDSMYAATAYVLVDTVGITYTYTDSDGCSASINANPNLIFSVCEAIQTITPANLFDLYPNPAGDYTMIAIDPSAIGSTLKLYDITGREIMNTQLRNTPQSLNLAHLPAGVYTVALAVNGQVGVKLLVKTE